jgi:hypothetical protein
MLVDDHMSARVSDPMGPGNQLSRPPEIEICGLVAIGA